MRINTLSHGTMPFQQRTKYTLLLLTALVMLIALPRAQANGLPEPTGEILLIVSGNIENTNHPDGAAFDMEMLEAMEVTSFETNTPWTKGLTRFTGVRLTALLSAVSATTSNIKMTAEDGYIYELERKIEDKYPVIIAYKKDDDYMSIRQLGPLWLMFPFDDFPELDTEENRAASVWQLKQMEIH